MTLLKTICSIIAARTTIALIVISTVLIVGFVEWDPVCRYNAGAGDAWSKEAWSKYNTCGILGFSPAKATWLYRFGTKETPNIK